MDRTAWIAVILCVVALVLWEIYVTRQMQLRPAPAPPPSPAAPALVSPAPTPLPPSGTPAPQTATGGATAVSSHFPEKLETLRNADAELHLTNRGGAIKEIVLLNYSAEGGQRVVLSSANTIPVGAMVDQPTNPILSEFTAKRNQDGSVQVRSRHAGPSDNSEKVFLHAVQGQERQLPNCDGCRSDQRRRAAVFRQCLLRRARFSRAGPR